MACRGLYMQMAEVYIDHIYSITQEPGRDLARRQAWIWQGQFLLGIIAFSPSTVRPDIKK